MARRYDGRQADKLATAGRARTVARAMWGEVQSLRKKADGVWWAETAGHGGYVLLTYESLGEWAKDFRVMWWNIGTTRCISGYAFEEDCAWALLEMARPNILEAAYNERRKWAEQDSRMTLFPTINDYRAHVRGVAERWHTLHLAAMEREQAEADVVGTTGG